LLKDHPMCGYFSYFCAFDCDSNSYFAPQVSELFQFNKLNA
jgi:hypothetical protein